MLEWPRKGAAWPVHLCDCFPSGASVILGLMALPAAGIYQVLSVAADALGSVDLKDAALHL